MYACKTALEYKDDSIRLCVNLCTGPVIALEYNGDECCTHCQEQVIAVSKGSTGLVFVSNSPVAATRHIDAFFSFANKEMLP